MEQGLKPAGLSPCEQHIWTALPPRSRLPLFLFFSPPPPNISIYKQIFSGSLCDNWKAGVNDFFINPGAWPCDPCSYHFIPGSSFLDLMGATPASKGRE